MARPKAFLCALAARGAPLPGACAPGTALFSFCLALVATLGGACESRRGYHIAVILIRKPVARRGCSLPISSLLWSLRFAPARRLERNLLQCAQAIGATGGYGGRMSLMQNSSAPHALCHFLSQRKWGEERLLRKKRKNKPHRQPTKTLLYQQVTTCQALGGHRPKTKKGPPRKHAVPL